MKSTLPLVSIVMPVYNGASKGMLDDAIRSCLQQTYKNIELILVDDCSTDDTYPCFEKFMNMDERVRVIRNIENKKLPASLNIGFEAAKGEYYTWTSDDNFYIPTAIEEMLVCLEANKNISIVYAGFVYIDKNKQKIKYSKVGSCELLAFYNRIGACFLYKCEVHEALGGYDTNLFLIEDYDFWLRAYSQFEYMYIDKYLYQYTEHEMSLSQTRQREVCRADLYLAKKNIVSNQKFSISSRRRRCWHAIKGGIKYLEPYMAVYFCFKYLGLTLTYYLDKLSE